MREFLSGLFEVSLTMGAVTALLLILSPVWKRRFRPQWRCWAWLLVALRLAVPFNVSLPRALLCRFTQCLRVNYAHFEPLCLLISSRSSWQLAQVRQP